MFCVDLFLYVHLEQIIAGKEQAPEKYLLRHYPILAL